mgnify:CR=1 FL=1
MGKKIISNYQAKYYNKGDYSAIHPYIDRKIGIIKRYFSNFNNLSILDIGCYTGEVTAELKLLGAKAIGCDISLISLQKAKEKNVEVVQVDVSDNIPFKDNSFDLVYCSEVIEHLMDTDKFLIEIKRTLKTEGLLFLTTPNIVALKNRFRLLFGKYPFNLEYKMGGAGHVHLYNKEKLNEQLKENGFNVIKFYGINIIPWSLCTKSKIIYRFNSLISNQLSSLCLNMAVISMKE